MDPESCHLPEYTAGFGNYRAVDFTNRHLCALQGNEKDVGQWMKWLLIVEVYVEVCVNVLYM